jgi:hypothetical protein
MLLIAFADADLVRAVSDYKEQKKGGKCYEEISKEGQQAAVLSISHSKSQKQSRTIIFTNFS